MPHPCEGCRAVMRGLSSAPLQAVLQGLAVSDRWLRQESHDLQMPHPYNDSPAICQNSSRTNQEWPDNLWLLSFCEMACRSGLNICKLRMRFADLMRGMTQ